MKKVIAICLIVIIVLSFTACNKEKSIEGTWERTYTDGTVLLLKISPGGYATEELGTYDKSGNWKRATPSSFWVYEWSYDSGTIKLVRGSTTFKFYDSDTDCIYDSSDHTDTPFKRVN